MDSETLECLAIHAYDINKRFYKRNKVEGWNKERWNGGVILWRPYEDGIEIAPYRGWDSRDWALRIPKECERLARIKGFKKILMNVNGFDRFMKKCGYKKVENYFVREL